MCPLIRLIRFQNNKTTKKKKNVHPIIRTHFKEKDEITVYRLDSLDDPFTSGKDLTSYTTLRGG